MERAIIDFLNNKINLKQLKEICGTNLHNVKVDFVVEVKATDVISTIKKYLDQKITLQEMVDWVNVVWFTDLFDYAPAEEDAIASVMTELETMDEEGICFSKEQLQKMIYCLNENKEY